MTRIIESMGYWGIALLMFLENIVPPLPSELIMPLGGFVAARGELTLVGVIVAGTIGSVIGQIPLYFLGRWVGIARLQRWADRHGRWLLISGDDVARAKRWFDSRGSAAVFLCRLVPGVRSLISIPAGVAEVSFVRFLVYSAAGMGIWAGALAWIGSLLGDNHENIEHLVGPASYVVYAVLAIVVVLFIVRRYRARRTAGREAPAPTSDEIRRPPTRA